MDWKIFLATFGTIFLAELGDKTQLAAISMVAKSKAPLTVFLGSVGAFAIVTLIGVLFGEALVKFLPENYIHIGAGVLFVVIGALILSGKL